VERFDVRLRAVANISGLRVRMLLLCMCCRVGACGCVYLLSTFSNVNVTMCVYFIVAACNYLYLIQRVYVSVAACICCSSRPCDSVSILISVLVFSVPNSVCQNVFFCGTVSIYIGQCPYARVILYIYCSVSA
jgi:hypothetical protein